MNPQEEQLARLEQKIDAIHIGTEKTRKYILFMLIGSVVMVLLPIILGAIMIPFVLSLFGGIYGG